MKGVLAALAKPSATPKKGPRCAHCGGTHAKDACPEPPLSGGGGGGGARASPSDHGSAEEEEEGGDEEEDLETYELGGTQFLLNPASKKILWDWDEGEPVFADLWKGCGHVAVLRGRGVDWVWKKKKVEGEYYVVNVAGHVKNNVGNGGAWVGVIMEGKVVAGTKPDWA